MSGQHTPGPWGWDGLKLYGFAGEQIIDYATYEGMWFASYGQPKKQAANMALIAAAPDLLEALRWFANNPGAHPENIASVARAAIAKVEGKQ